MPAAGLFAQLRVEFHAHMPSPGGLGNALMPAASPRVKILLCLRQAFLLARIWRWLCLRQAPFLSVSKISLCLHMATNYACGKLDMRVHVLKISYYATICASACRNHVLLGLQPAIYAGSRADVCQLCLQQADISTCVRK